MDDMLLNYAFLLIREMLSLTDSFSTAKGVLIVASIRPHFSMIDCFEIVLCLFNMNCSALGSNNFSGTLPPEIGNLAKLELL